MKTIAPKRLHVSDSVRSALFATAMAAGIEEVAAAGSIGGTVFDPDDNPAAGVTVELQRTIGLSTTTLTDAQGKYNFPNPSSGCYSIKASSPSFGSYFLGDTIDEKDRVVLDFVSTVEVADADIHAQFGSRSVAGVVRFLTADPPDEVVVGLRTPEGNRTAVEWTIGEGNPGEYPFTMANVPQGDYVVYARRINGFFPWYNGDTGSVFDATVTHVAGSPVTGIQVDLPAVSVVVATVRDANGDPLTNRVVTVTEVPFSSPSALGYTDLSGEVTIPVPGVVPGSQVWINSFGGTFEPAFGNRDGTFASLSEPFVLSAGDNLVDLTEPSNQGAVSGHLSTSGTGTAISFGQVRLESAVANGRLHFFAWQRQASFMGDWSIASGVPPDWYVVTAKGANSVNDYHVEKTSAVFLGTGQVTRNLDLEVGGRAQVAVQTTGSPVVGAQVRLFDASCEWVATGFSGFGGVYFSPNIRTGNYIACAEGTGFEKRCSGGATSCQAATPFNVGASTTTNTQLDLPARTVRRISGTLRDAAGNPVPFTPINLGAFIFPTGGVITNECGEFTIEGVPGQIVTVGATHPEKGDLFGTVTIGNTDKVEDLTLVPYTSAIWGRVTDDEDEPLQGARLCLDTEQHCVESDSGGYYRLGARPGTHSLWLTGSFGYEPQVVGGVQVAATPLQRDFSLEDVAIDAYEANDLTNSLTVTAGVRYDRSFASAEDVDWQRFNAQSGKYYKARFFGVYNDKPTFAPNVAIFDDATKTLDRAGAGRLLEGTFTPTVSGVYRLGVSWFASGSYEMELTESDTPVTPTPAVSSIDPTSGSAAGGTPFTITGTDFEPDATVWFGTQWATNVTVVNSTTITGSTPSLPAGTLQDVTVDNPTPGSATVGPRRPAVSGTLPKAWFADFGDVPQSHLFHGAIETVFRAGITTGCGGGNYCPGDPVTRDAMAVFILRGKNGGAFLPPPATGNVLEDVGATTFLARWMEQFFSDGISTGCGTSPGASKPNYCPTGNVTRDGMSVFLLRGKNGSAFLPPVATGTVFGDVTAATFLARWMEGLKAANITQGCGGGNYCPAGLVSRGEMASFVRRTFGL